MSRAFYHRGVAIEFDEHVPRLTIDGQPIPLPPELQNATLEERLSADVNALIERARKHVDASPGFGERDAIRDTHLRELRKGVAHWNEWRQAHVGIRPLLYDADLCGENLSGANLANANLILADLRGAMLIETNFHEANLGGADMCCATLTRANFCRTDLYDTDLSHANLEGANLQGTQLARTDFRSATLVNCRIYGFSAWDLKLDEHTRQTDLVIFHYKEPDPQAAHAAERVGEPGRVIVDDLRVAQFVYLMLHNENIRYVLDAMSKKAVLILGRFSGGRLAELHKLRQAIRALDQGFIPLLFDFEKPSERDLDETIRILAGLSRFVIADLTDALSAPLEIKSILDSCAIPIVPLIKKGATFPELLRPVQVKYRLWFLREREYTSIDDLLANIEATLVAPALEAEKRIAAERAAPLF